MNAETKVLALKYRPKRFEDLVGQATISQTLSLALDSNRLSHAYLFSGLRGSGKTSTARIMAKAFLCSQGPTSKPCEVCENCLSANENRHLDIIEMDAASNRGIDDIKDLIEHTKYKPSSARFKVFIIDEVHMLTTQAFNALLKTLEEPPGFVKFILATTDPLKLPATILSRTQHFRFKKIAHKDVIHHLMHILNEEQIEFESEALEIIARSGQGSLRDTLTLLDQAIIFAKGKVTTIAVVDMLGLIDPQFMDEIFDIILNKEDPITIVTALEEYEAGQVCDEMTIYLKQKMLERSVKFDTLLFDRFFRIIADAKHLLAMNSDPSFVLLLMLSKMTEAVNLKTIDEVINEIESIEVKESQKVCQTTLVSAIEEDRVIEHSHEHNNNIVAPVVQGVYHDETPTAIKEDLDQECVIEYNQVPTTPFEHSPAAIQAVEANQQIQEVSIPVEQMPVPESMPTEISNPFEAPVEAVEIQNETVVSVQESVNNFEAPNVTLEEPTEISNPFATPFDEVAIAPVKIEPTVEEKVEKPVEQEVNTQAVEQTQEAIQVTEPEPSMPDEPVTVQPQTVQTAQEPILQETPKKLEEVIANDFMNQVPALEEEQDDQNKNKFELVINRAYDRDIQLGEAFEDNFFYKTFENKELLITSYAQGDTRKFLLQHYGVLKTFFYDVYGNDIELKFETVEREKKSNEVSHQEVQPQETNVQETQSEANNNYAGSMIEDIEMGAGCVADMQKTAHPKPSQKELEINDILNSPMLNKAKELFDIKKITVKTKT